MNAYREWSAGDAAACVAIPEPGDDKYSRGVIGVITGSIKFPGAAVLGVEAALRTGVGMVRYLGPASGLVLQRRPEAVTVPGRVQAWLIGSGMDVDSRDAETTSLIITALAERLPTVLDSGALDLVSRALGPVVVTPHYRELAGMLGATSVDAATRADPEHPSAAEIAADPGLWCGLAAERLGVTVLLKGSRTHIAGPDGTRLVTPPASPWLATAGTGDALAGILGALLATHAEQVPGDSSLLARLAATAAVLHAEAAERAGGGGPLTVLDLAAELPGTIAKLLREHPRAE